MAKVKDVLHALDDLTGGRCVKDPSDWSSGKNRFVVTKTSNIPAIHAYGKSIADQYLPRCHPHIKRSDAPMETIKIGILGYGNLGRGVECAIAQNPDMKLVGVFTRRDPASVTIRTPGVPVLPAEALEKGLDIDVLVLCGGSATDLPAQTPHYAALYNVIDSFDNHSHIPQHFAAVDDAARAAGKVATISTGWDPGLFSLMRCVAASSLPQGENYTFWGKGVSQGHSDAIRRIPGVVDARQYTIPVERALALVRSGANPTLTTREKHKRECFVVAEEGADLAAIEREIVTMPAYFADYDTTVHFISLEELRRDHSGIPHGGFVIRSGKTGADGENTELMEFRLQLDSNPEFTASVIASYARATYRMAQKGETGCKTILDIPVAYASPLSGEALRKSLL